MRYSDYLVGGFPRALFEINKPLQGLIYFNRSRVDKVVGITLFTDRTYFYLHRSRAGRVV